MEQLKILTSNASHFTNCVNVQMMMNDTRQTLREQHLEVDAEVNLMLMFSSVFHTSSNSGKIK